MSARAVMCHSQAGCVRGEHSRQLVKSKSVGKAFLCDLPKSGTDGCSVEPEANCLRHVGVNRSPLSTAGTGTASANAAVTGNASVVPLTASPLKVGLPDDGSDAKHLRSQKPKACALLWQNGQAMPDYQQDHQDRTPQRNLNRHER